MNTGLLRHLPKKVVCTGCPALNDGGITRGPICNLGYTIYLGEEDWQSDECQLHLILHDDVTFYPTRRQQDRASDHE